MNAAEHIVEAYFRYCESCFTITDRKVKKGNNRQLDLLAYNVRNGRQFHVETGVTHRENWCPTLEVLAEKFEKKFFGVPPKRTGATHGRTDSERGKSYFPQINATYREMGFDPSRVERIWVCWFFRDNPDDLKTVIQYRSAHVRRRFKIEILSLRNCILPALEQKIETANYDDEVLRTLGFMKERQAQLAKVKRNEGVEETLRAELKI